jgi:hypothetical protein
MEIPVGADEARIEKVYKGRERMFAKASEKFRFNVEPLSTPDGLIIEDNRLIGLRFRRTKIEDGRVIPTDETYERRGVRVISSIGSIPEPIEGIPMKGELFDFSDWEVGRIDGFPTLFSVGNVVTGKGNIVASRKHARQVSADAIEAFLGLAEDGRDAEADLPNLATDAARETADRIATQLGTAPDPSTLAEILRRVAERQREVGYTDYESWIESQTAPT